MEIKKDHTEEIKTPFLKEKETEKLPLQRIIFNKISKILPSCMIDFFEKNVIPGETKLIAKIEKRLQKLKNNLEKKKNIQTLIPTIQQIFNLYNNAIKENSIRGRDIYQDVLETSNMLTEKLLNNKGLSSSYGHSALEICENMPEPPPIGFNDSWGILVNLPLRQLGLHKLEVGTDDRNIEEFTKNYPKAYSVLLTHSIYSNKYEYDGEKRLSLFKLLITTKGGRESAIAQCESSKIDLDRLSEDEQKVLFNAYLKYDLPQLLRRFSFFQDKYRKLPEEEKDGIFDKILDRINNIESNYERENYIENIVKFIEREPLKKEQWEKLKILLKKNHRIENTNSFDELKKWLSHKASTALLLQKNADILDIKTNDQRSVIFDCCENPGELLSLNRNDCPCISDDDVLRAAYNLTCKSCNSSFGKEHFNSRFFENIDSLDADHKEKFLKQAKLTIPLDILILKKDYYNDSEKIELRDNLVEILQHHPHGHSEMATMGLERYYATLPQEKKIELLDLLFDKLSSKNEASIFSNIYGHVERSIIDSQFPQRIRLDFKRDIENYMKENIGNVLSSIDIIEVLRQDIKRCGYLFDQETRDKIELINKLIKEDFRVRGFYNSFDYKFATKAYMQDIVSNLFQPITSAETYEKAQKDSKFLMIIILNSPEFLSQRLIVSDKDSEYLDYSFLPHENKSGAINQDQFKNMINMLINSCPRYTNPVVILKYFKELDIAKEECFKIINRLSQNQCAEILQLSEKKIINQEFIETVEQRKKEQKQ